MTKKQLEQEIVALKAENECIRQNSLTRDTLIVVVNSRLTEFANDLKYTLPQKCAVWIDVIKAKYEITTEQKL